MTTLLAVIVIVQALVLIALLVWIVRLIRQRDDALREAMKLRNQLDASVIRLDKVPEAGTHVVFQYQTEWQQIGGEDEMDRARDFEIQNNLYRWDDMANGRLP